jgi:hypothetical protein
MERCDLMELELIGVVSGKIWFRRNGVVYGKTFIHPQQMFQKASMSLDDFRRANAPGLAASSFASIDPPMYWQPPPTSLYKVNWDVAVDNNNGRIGVGIVVQDFEGVVVAARSATKIFMVAPVVVEALAAFNAMELCNEMGFVDIILEGEALQIVNAVKNNRQQRVSLDTLWMESKLGCAR